MKEAFFEIVVRHGLLMTWTDQYSCVGVKAGLLSENYFEYFREYCIKKEPLTEFIGGVK